MLIHEDPELEEAAMNGILPIIVPVSVFVPSTGALTVTAYEAVWNACTVFESRFADDPLSDSAKDYLISAVKGVVGDLGYAPDPRESRVTLEYSLDRVTESIKENAENAVLVTSPDQLCSYKCRLLHKPDPDDVSENTPLSVTICGDEIASAASINDFSDTDAAEINVETAPDHRGRGFGRAAVAALSLELIRRGERVSYKCAQSNTASGRIAENLGFTLDGRRLDIVCFED